MPALSNPSGLIVFPHLLSGRLLQRKNRFVVRVRLEDGEVVEAHTNNTGTMRTCSDPGSQVFLSESANPKRKLKYSLMLVRSGEALVGVDTSLPQKAFVAAVSAGRLPEFHNYRVAGSEVTVAPGSRLDVLLDGPSGPAYVELKNVTLQENGRLYFPDAVTSRGRKHLLELARLVKETGVESYAVFICQRPDGDALYPADHIDPEFAETLRKVATQGVVPLAYRAEVSTTGVALAERLPVVLEHPGGSAVAT